MPTQSSGRVFDDLLNDIHVAAPDDVPGLIVRHGAALGVQDRTKIGARL